MTKSQMIIKNNRLIKKLSKLIEYHPTTGKFYWNAYIGSRIKPGMIAGHKSQIGYWIITYQGRPLKAHRLAWFKIYGFIPDCLDHINGNTIDNRISNLRESNVIENGRNRIEHRNGSLLGTSFRKDNNKWIAQYWIKNKKLHIGQFNTQEEAHNAYLIATKRRKI